MLLASLIVTATAAVFTLSEWLVSEHRRLEAHLAQLQVRQIQVVRVASEIARLDESEVTSAPSPITPDRLKVIADSANDAGLALEFSALDEFTVSFTGKGETHALIRWLGRVQVEHGARPATLEAITRDGADELQGLLRWTAS